MSFLLRKEPVIIIRNYQSQDLPALHRLFCDSILFVCQNDYTKEELLAWSQCFETNSWEKSLQEHDSLVAQMDDVIVGFCDRDRSYIDRLYVHKDYQHLHIATKLLKYQQQHAEQEGISVLTTHASRTAKGFFEKQGYRVLHAQKVERFSQVLENFVMEKRL